MSPTESRTRGGDLRRTRSTPSGPINVLDHSQRGLRRIVRGRVRAFSSCRQKDEIARIRWMGYIGNSSPTALPPFLRGFRSEKLRLLPNLVAMMGGAFACSNHPGVLIETVPAATSIWLGMELVQEAQPFRVRQVLLIAIAICFMVWRHRVRSSRPFSTAGDGRSHTHTPFLGYPEEHPVNILKL